MINVLEQIIQLYPNSTIVVTTENGSAASGYPGALLTAPNYGLLQLTDCHCQPQEAISLCKIASVRITCATYDNAISYLPQPAPLDGSCGANCQAAIRDYLPVGTAGASIKAGGQTVAQGTVIKNKFGMLVLVGPNNCDPTFVSICKIEMITKKTPCPCW